jgi:hypothetical protein
MRLQLDALRAKHTPLLARLADAEQALVALRADLSTSRSQFSSAQAQLSEMHGMHEDLAKELSHKIDILQRAEAELEVLRAYRTSNAQTVRELESHCESVRFDQTHGGTGMLLSTRLNRTCLSNVSQNVSLCGFTRPSVFLGIRIATWLCGLAQGCTIQDTSLLFVGSDPQHADCQTSDCCGDSKRALCSQGSLAPRPSNSLLLLVFTTPAVVSTLPAPPHAATILSCPQQIPQSCASARLIPQALKLTLCTHAE